MKIYRDSHAECGGIDFGECVVKVVAQLGIGGMSAFVVLDENTVKKSIS